MLLAKLHGLRVTGAELHYEGSIAIDSELLERSRILPFQFVEIWNKASGARITTYTIPGERGSRCCVLNGAAARTCQVGDELIIAARAEVEPAGVAALRPRVLIFGEGNVLQSTTVYRILADGTLQTEA
jgi:aspartate 1-decarboxylase